MASLVVGPPVDLALEAGRRQGHQAVQRSEPEEHECTYLPLIADLRDGFSFRCSDDRRPQLVSMLLDDWPSFHTLCPHGPLAKASVRVAVAPPATGPGS